MKALKEIPKKAVYRLPEVCELTDTQPYVLRFWESEFPQLAPEKGRSGQPVYRRADLDLILRIKKLLYEEEYTLAGARRRLEEESDGIPEPSREVRGRETPSVARKGRNRPTTVATSRPESGEPDSTARSAEVTTLRAEIESLRERLARAEKGGGDPDLAAARLVAAEAARAAAERALEIRKARSLEVAERLEALLARLDEAARSREPGGSA